MTAKAEDERKAGLVMPGILVDPEWLGDHMGDPRMRIVDLRDREAYAGGHIIGTVQLDLEDLGENRDGCDNVVLGPAEFERLMARLGISNRDTVVAYDDHWGLRVGRHVARSGRGLRLGRVGRTPGRRGRPPCVGSPPTGCPPTN